MMLKTGKKVAQNYSVLNYGTSIPRNNAKFQYIMIMAEEGVNLETYFFLPGKNKENLGRKSSQMHCSWITWKHHWPTQWISIGITQTGTLWIGS